MMPAESTTQLARRALDHLQLVCAGKPEAQAVAAALADSDIKCDMKPSILGNGLWTVRLGHVSAAARARAMRALDEREHTHRPQPAAAQHTMVHQLDGQGRLDLR